MESRIGTKEAVCEDENRFDDGDDLFKLGIARAWSREYEISSSSISLLLATA